jgi:SAM-dependent methyltransferase
VIAQLLFKLKGWLSGAANDPSPDMASPPIPAAGRETWLSGLDSEVSWWRGVINAVGDEAQWHDELAARAQPDKPFADWLVPLITTAPLSEAKVLDVAAGPISVLGWVHDGKPVAVTAVDALADEYNQMLDRKGLTPPVRTVRCEAENLSDIFPPASFDLVYMQNALDHCYDPLRVIDSALKLLKPGASFIISSYINEAASAHYEGLHQWNVDIDEGEMVLWRPDARIRVADVLGDAFQVTNHTYAPEENWLVFRITARSS